MAIAHRNGRPYLYRSVRRGGRVTSEYVGQGEFALLFGALEADQREQEGALRERTRDEQRQLDDLDRALDALAKEARDLARENLNAAGYHQYHRGEWRKRRHVRAHRDGREG